MFLNPSGSSLKFVDRVESVSVSLKELRASRVLVITEMAVLEWHVERVELLEVAPGALTLIGP